MFTKKIVVITLLIDFIIVIVAISIFACNSTDLPEQKIVDICKIIIQSTIAGAITFTGLLLTFSSQESQTKKKNRLEICPCFIIEEYYSLSAVKEEKNIAITPNTVMCSKSKKLRTVECSFINCKNNYGLNVNIQTNDGYYKLGNVKSQNNKLIFVVDAANEGDILITFEDVYGYGYNQKIKYIYQNSNQIVFTSSQPERRKQNVCKHK